MKIPHISSFFPSLKPLGRQLPSLPRPPPPWRRPCLKWLQLCYFVAPLSLIPMGNIYIHFIHVIHIFIVHWLIKNFLEQKEFVWKYNVDWVFARWGNGCVQHVLFVQNGALTDHLQLWGNLCSIVGLFLITGHTLRDVEWVHDLFLFSLVLGKM